MRRHLFGTAVVLLLAVLAAGCGSGGSSQAFQRLLPRVIGPAEHFDVRVSGASGERLSSARIRANRLQADQDLIFDSAAIDLSDVRYSRASQELLGVSRADYSAVLLQEDLNAALARRSSLVRNLRVRFTAGGVQLRGTTDIPGVKLPITPEISMDGHLAINAEGGLDFRPDRVRAIGIEIPSVAGQVLATQINPLVDLSMARLPVYLRDFELANGEVRLAGRALVRTGRYGE